MFSSNFYVWGAGTYGARLIEFMKNELTFKGVIDNDQTKHPTLFHGLKVVSYAEAKSQMPDVKVVIAQVYPNVVRDFLLAEGFKEYTDFVSIYDFIPRYFWEKKRQVVPKVVNMAPSNFCNLKCKNCQSFMHLVKKPRVTPAEELISDIDLLYRHVDSVFLINLCLGESFLNMEISKFAKHLFTKYRGRYGNIVVLTNGTIIPNDDEMAAFSETDTIISISDYSKEDSTIKKSLKSLICKCRQFGVKYYLNTSSNTDCWFDFGDPLMINETRAKELRRRFDKCFKPGCGLRDGKLYLCQIQNILMAVTGDAALDEGDYFDLSQSRTEASKETLLKIISRTPDRGYIEHCKSCRGTSPINKKG